MKRFRKKGFAIVLVASLAGLVFLLGASLVAIMQLQTAAAGYDQRMRLAREHARTALDIAIGELQAKLGSDTAVSYIADVYRSDTLDDFRSPTGNPPNVTQPFWTAAVDPGESVAEQWLVTRPIASDFGGTGSSGSLADPLASEFADVVTLVGPETVTTLNAAHQSLMEVRVPKEEIRADNVKGYTDERSIGHYAYWVGDLGVKASYALYDAKDFIAHDEYVSTGGQNRRDRLSQLRVAKPNVDFVDTNVTTQSPTLDNSNVVRIDTFTSDFQFRDDYGLTTSDDLKDDRYLIDLEAPDVRDFFHDFTPLSKGLLTNSASGGFKLDMSALTPLVGAEYDTYNGQLLPYANLAKQAISTASDYDDDVFPLSAGASDSLPIHPVLTQFNLNYTIFFDETDGVATEYDLRLSFAAGFELWNPFSSAISAESIRFEVEGLPTLQLDNVSPFWREPLSSLSKQPVFRTPATVSGKSFWRPGQVAVFTGPESANAETSPYLLTQSELYHADSTSRVWIDDIGVTVTGYVDSPLFSFRDDEGRDDAAIVVKMYVNDTNELLASYELNGFDYQALDRSFDPIENSPSFGFSWEIKDSKLPYYDKDNFPDLAADYHPFVTLLEESALHGFEQIAKNPIHYNPTFFQPATAASVDYKNDRLLGYNPSEFAGTLLPIYDLSLFQLPKQEVTSVAQLRAAYGDTWQVSLLGEPDNAANFLFDAAFFSTIPQDAGSNWNASDSLPNSGYKPLDGFTEAQLTGADSANKLFIHGLFNVHSTSIAAWTSLLKSVSASQSLHWASVLDNLDGALDGVLGVNRYLFFNYPNGGEDRFDFNLAPSLVVNQFRASHSQSVFIFTDQQVNALAKHIVSQIRKRLRGDSPYQLASDNGPFTSLQEFVDSEVLANAIAAANTELGNDALSKSFVFPGTPAEFKQSTILNLIAPYLSVRSDTFLVRAYGDAVDPADPTKIWARAYCEAIVQRTHGPYKDGTYGRKMEVVAFRWLSPSEI